MPILIRFEEKNVDLNNVFKSMFFFSKNSAQLAVFFKIKNIQMLFIDKETTD